VIGVIFLALLAHLSYAGNDLTGALGSRLLSAARMALYAWLCGLVLILLSAPFLFRGTISLQPLIVNVILAFLMAIAYPTFLYTLQHGNATINGVIAGTFPIWVVILSLIFFDETLFLSQTVAIVIIFIGAILSSLHLTNKTRLHNLFSKYSLLALLVSVLWGIYFAFIRYPIEQYGWFEASAITQLAATAFSVVLLLPLVRHAQPLKFKISQLKWPLLNGATGFSGGLAYNLALTLGASSIVAPIAGSYPGLYAVASYYVFKETLTKIQLTGVILVLLGVIMLSLVSV
jgi:drug/metabolite transporter (DMT)-like permease